MGNPSTERPELVRRATELVPVLRERAKRTETLRCIPQETVDDLRSAELLRAGTPKRFGGHGLEHDVLLELVYELGRGCGSTAWCYAVWAAGSWGLGLWPEMVQREVWADSADTLLSGGLSPAGARVEEVDGGYLLSGRWDFASGCDAASWMTLVGRGRSGPLTLLVPKSEVTIEDTWYVSGLCGTGSKDVVVQETFVPDYRALAMTDVVEARAPGRKLHPTLGYRVPFWSAAGYVLAASVAGMAQGALEAFERSMASKVSEVRGGGVAEAAGLQMSLAEAAVEIEAALLIMRHDAQETLERARRQETPSLDDRVRYRRNQAYMTTLAVRAVNRLFDASGGHSLFDSDPIQRFHRDIHAGSHHAQYSWHSVSQQYGRVRLGLAPTNPRY